MVIPPRTASADSLRHPEKGSHSAHRPSRPLVGPTYCRSDQGRLSEKAPRSPKVLEECSPQLSAVRPAKRNRLQLRTWRESIVSEGRGRSERHEKIPAPRPEFRGKPRSAGPRECLSTRRSPGRETEKTDRAVRWDHPSRGGRSAEGTRVTGRASGFALERDRPRLDTCERFRPRSVRRAA